MTIVVVEIADANRIPANKSTSIEKLVYETRQTWLDLSVCVLIIA